MMRFLPVWLYLNFKELFDKLIRNCQWLFKGYCRVVCWLMKNISISMAFKFLHIKRVLGMIGSHQKNLSQISRENKRCLLGDAFKIDFTWVAQRRQILDFAATYGQNKTIIAQLAQCSLQLDEIVKPLHQAGTPVILAPMHMVSDILAGIVAGNTYPNKGTVIVSVNAEMYQEQDRVRGGINLSYCSIHGNNESIAGNLVGACMEALDHKTNIIIFPDIVPDYTEQAGAAHSSKIKCHLFERPAHIHSGVVRLAKMISASVVMYYLYYEDGIKIHIYPVMNDKEVREKLPELIESAIKNNPQDWLLWHLHSLYFFND